MSEAHAECINAGCSYPGSPTCATGVIYNVPVGTIVVPWNYAQNDGDEANAIAVMIVQNGVEVVFEQEWCEVGDCVNGNSDSAYSFVMPDSSVSLQFNAKHAKDGVWQPRDYHHTITLTPQEPTYKYRCTGAPNYDCVEDVDGEYDSLTACMQNCKAPSLPELTVNSDPDDAKIYIQYNQSGDYSYTGYKTNIILGVPAGTHNVKVTKDGYEEPDPQVVTLVAGESETISFELTLEEITLNLQPTKTTISPEEEFCPEVYCPTGVDNVGIYVDNNPTPLTVAHSGNLPNIKCKPLFPNDFDKLTGNDLGGLGTHSLQARTSILSSNIVNIMVAEDSGALGSIVEYPESIPEGNYDLGWDYHLQTKIKNIGNKLGEFRLYYYHNGQWFGNNPFLHWENIEAGAIEAFDDDISRKLVEGDIIRLELWEQSKHPDGEPDHVVEIPIGFVGCPAWADWLTKIAGVSCPTAQAIIIGAVILILIMLVK